MTFADTLRAVQAANRDRLKARAFLASHLAKATTGQARKACYAIKHAAISQLFLNRWAVVNGVSLFPELLVGVTFPSGGSLHAKPQFLTEQAQELVFAQIETRLRRKDHGAPSPIHKEKSHAR